MTTRKPTYERVCPRCEGDCYVEIRGRECRCPRCKGQGIVTEQSR